MTVKIISSVSSSAITAVGILRSDRYVVDQIVQAAAVSQIEATLAVYEDISAGIITNVSIANLLNQRIKLSTAELLEDMLDDLRAMLLASLERATLTSKVRAISYDDAGNIEDIKVDFMYD
jgi:ABC-type ATPase with predicted acetyltransferase domain